MSFLKKSKDLGSYALIRTLGWPLSFLPLRLLHASARLCSRTTYFLLRGYRKRATANLANARALNLQEKDIPKIAKRSLDNLFITLFEYFWIPRNRQLLDQVVSYDNFSVVKEILQQGKGMVILSGHQANWELGFIRGTKDNPGVAIGKDLRNPYLNRWLRSVREIFGAEIIPPQQALKSGLKFLRRGISLGIVGDQALPSSSYSYPLFGTRAWLSSAPALLAYKSSCPLVVVSTRRERQNYVVRFCDPIWPEEKLSFKENIISMMNRAFSQMEASIARRPEQWLWYHKQWKQDGVNGLQRKYRHEFILIILPPSQKLCPSLLKAMETLRKLYSRSFFTIAVHEGSDPSEIPSWAETQVYKESPDLQKGAWRFQMVFNFSGQSSYDRIFLKRSASYAFTRDDLDRTGIGNDLSEKICSILCKPDQAQAFCESHAC